MKKARVVKIEYRGEIEPLPQDHPDFQTCKAIEKVLDNLVDGGALEEYRLHPNPTPYLVDLFYKRPSDKVFTRIQI